MKIFLASPRGFCAGVERAIYIVEKALEKHGAPIYVRHEVVHNRFVVNDLKNKGAIFVEEIADIPNNSVVIFSAHGVSKKVKQEALNKESIIFDATCPLVTKVHKEVARSRAKNESVILIGHANHPEVDGTMGQCEDENSIHLIESIDDVNKLSLADNDSISYTTQTTLSVDDTQDIIDKLKQKYPNITPPNKDDICYATQNRQDIVKQLMSVSDVLFVLGSANSSNSNRLKEIAIKLNKPAYLIDDYNEIKPEWLLGVNNIALTAGASAPEVLVQEVITRLKELGVSEVITNKGIQENVIFPLPKELR